MNRVTLIFVLTMSVLLGSSGVCWGADLQKGQDAFKKNDYATALKEWTPLAKQGNARAQYNLGWMNYKGYGVPKDYETAVKWYTLAAEQGLSADWILSHIMARREFELKLIGMDRKALLEHPMMRDFESEWECKLNWNVTTVRCEESHGWGSKKSLEIIFTTVGGRRNGDDKVDKVEKRLGEYFIRNEGPDPFKKFNEHVTYHHQKLSKKYDLVQAPNGAETQKFKNDILRGSTETYLVYFYEDKTDLKRPSYSLLVAYAEYNGPTLLELWHTSKSFWDENVVPVLRSTKAKEEAKLRSTKAKEEAKCLTLNESRLERVQSNLGFRDLKPGMTVAEIKKVANCSIESTSTCYGLDDLKFKGEFSPPKSCHILKTLTIDLGPIASSLGTFHSLPHYNDNPDDGNIYSSMRASLKKYKLDFEFSERDRELFNEGRKPELLVVYEKGKVALRVSRVRNDNSFDDIWLHVEYRDVDNGKTFFEQNKPKKASASDF